MSSFIALPPPFIFLLFFFFFFLQIKVLIASFSIIGALGPWSPWLSFYCQFTIIFVFFFHCTFYCPCLNLGFSLFVRRKEWSLQLYSLLLPRNGKKEKCGLTPNPIDGTSKDERMQVLR